MHAQTDSTDPPSSQLRSLYEEAMQKAASNTTTPTYSADLALKANFTNFCQAALGVCANYYNKELGGADDNATLSLEWGKHFMLEQGKHHPMGRFQGGHAARFAGLITVR
eukprot:scaffold292246_cov18-Tisochrysis_lutea.AAC.1